MKTVQDRESSSDVSSSSLISSSSSSSSLSDSSSNSSSSSLSSSVENEVHNNDSDSVVKGENQGKNSLSSSESDTNTSSSSSSTSGNEIHNDDKDHSFKNASNPQNSASLTANSGNLSTFSSSIGSDTSNSNETNSSFKQKEELKSMASKVSISVSNSEFSGNDASTKDIESVEESISPQNKLKVQVLTSKAVKPSTLSYLNTEEYINNEKYHFHPSSFGDSTVKSIILGGEDPFDDQEKNRRRIRTVSSISDEGSKYQKVNAKFRDEDSSVFESQLATSPARVLQQVSNPEVFGMRNNEDSSFNPEVNPPRTRSKRYSESREQSDMDAILTTSSLTDSYLSTEKSGIKKHHETEKMNDQNKNNISLEVESIKEALYSVSNVFDSEIRNVNHKIKDRYQKLDSKIGECIRHLIDLKGREMLSIETEINKDNRRHRENREDKNVKLESQHKIRDNLEQRSYIKEKLSSKSGDSKFMSPMTEKLNHKKISDFSSPLREVIDFMKVEQDQKISHFKDEMKRELNSLTMKYSEHHRKINNRLIEVIDRQQELRKDVSKLIERQLEHHRQYYEPLIHNAAIHDDQINSLKLEILEIEEKIAEQMKNERHRMYSVKKGFRTLAEALDVTLPRMFTHRFDSIQYPILESIGTAARDSAPIDGASLKRQENLKFQKLQHFNNANQSSDILKKEETRESVEVNEQRTLSPEVLNLQSLPKHNSDHSYITYNHNFYMVENSIPSKDQSRFHQNYGYSNSEANHLGLPQPNGKILIMEQNPPMEKLASSKSYNKGSLPVNVSVSYDKNSFNDRGPSKGNDFCSIETHLNIKPSKNSEEEDDLNLFSSDESDDEFESLQIKLNKYKEYRIKQQKNQLVEDKSHDDYISALRNKIQDLHYLQRDDVKHKYHHQEEKISEDEIKSDTNTM